MTTLAWDGKILAADTKVTAEVNGNLYKVGNTSKISIINGQAVAACGNCDDIERFEEWLTNGAKPEHFPKKLSSFGALILSEDGICQFFSEGVGKGLKPKYTPLAMGTQTGEHYVQGLMSTGMNAHDAVEKACDYCCHTGLPVYSITKEILSTLDQTSVFAWEGTYKDDCSTHRTAKKRKKSDSQDADGFTSSVSENSICGRNEETTG